MMFAVCILACAINGALGQDVALNDPTSDTAGSDPAYTGNDDTSQAPIDGSDPDGSDPDGSDPTGDGGSAEAEARDGVHELCGAVLVRGVEDT